jgi:1-acyl-sn-glycerol-3-phosphate acyltransferase
MIRTIVFFSWFWLSLVLTTPLCGLYLIASLFGLKRALARPMRAFVSGWARSLAAVAGATIEVRGLETIPDLPSICFIANHQGDMDVIGLLATLPRLSGYIAKRQGLFVPVMNVWLAALGCVFIHRGQARKAAADLERGAKRLRSGHSMVLFPEGTRSRGHRMNPFKRGAFKLPLMADAVIVPIAIDGTWKTWEAEHRIRPASMSFAFLEPIHTKGLDAAERKALPERVERLIALALDPMETAELKPLA